MTKFKNLSVSALLVFASALILSLPVQASTIYTAYPSFLGDFPDPTVENFEDTVLQPGLSVVSTYSGAVIENGVYKDKMTSTTTTTWTHSGGFAAWGGFFDLVGVDGPGVGISVTVVDTNEFIGEIDGSYNGGFWGFTTGYSFNQVQLTQGSGPGLERFTQGSGPEGEGGNYWTVDLVYAPVPEPATMVLFGLGLLGLAGISRKKL